MGNDIHDPTPTISTSRHEVDLLNPDPATIDLRDISWAMSNLARYTGHTDRPVSLLHHSVICDAYAAIVMECRDPVTRLAILLHDAHEAYTGDISRPMKRMLDKAAPGVIAGVEDGLDHAIWKSFGFDRAALLTGGDLEKVKLADNGALAAEVRVAWPCIVAEERWAGLVSIPRNFLRLVEVTLDHDIAELEAKYQAGVMACVERLHALGPNREKSHVH